MNQEFSDLYDDTYLAAGKRASDRSAHFPVGKGDLKIPIDEQFEEDLDGEFSISKALHAIDLPKPR